ncbi:major vault protein [Sinocyclocheilus grahami]|uniref:major vault protein n=1 Tax=Sinocyclocheilus grahami TaxID=75366 RepID=UPI0007ACDCDE|nr:PREDICTED: major vault protein-like [Sinocyclocheilus grahami]
MDADQLLGASIIRIPPHHYIHVLDQNTNIARVELGPLTYIRQDNERVLFAPVRMIMVPPRHYCVVLNPVARNAEGQVQFDASGQAKLRHADLEIRLTQDPFPLFPGEEIQKDVTPLQIVYPEQVLFAPVRMIMVPPRHYCVVLNPVARNAEGQVQFDASGQAKLRHADLEIRLTQDPFPLFPGEEIQKDVTPLQIVYPDTALRLQGERSFFLRPGEHLENGIQDVYVLSEEEGLVLRAVEAFVDTEGEELDEEEGESRAKKRGIQRRPGDRWMLRGPIEYVPPATVEVLLRRDAIPLDENEGIYVRDIKTGKVRAVIGQTYMLTQDEELWEKELPANVETLLSQSLADRSERGRNLAQAERDQTRVVSYRVPHNAAVQVYDYREKKARVVFGPEMVMLGPDEQFTILSLSGDKPKHPNVIKAICLLLGPDFCTDIITIETADHARLQLQLSYNWHFDIKQPAEAAKATALFSVPDFVGDACKAIASRIRGAVASVQFDDFHKNSNRIICSAVFGFDEKLAVRSSLRFNQNGLVISSVDIQSVEPVDQRTRDALQKSVQLAIEITTNSQEATARHEAERLEQEARGRLERQKITDQAEAEKARKELLELEAQSAAVESTGAAKAEAQSRAEAARIQGEAAVEEAKLKAEAQKIEADAELARLCKAREQELNYKKEMDQLEVQKQQKLAEIESLRFKELIESLGTETLKEMARAGPELQVKLLQSLGLKSTLITDGSSPINLFTTANGLLGALQGKGQDE